LLLLLLLLLPKAWSWLAYDRLRSSRQPGKRGAPDTTEVCDFAAATRQIAGKQRSYGLRPESKAWTAPCICFCFCFCL
jgi:hypothetical protein